MGRTIVLTPVLVLLVACSPSGSLGSGPPAPMPSPAPAPSTPPASPTGATDGGGGSPVPPPEPPELCDDGFDDDGDGSIDEGCACETGATQSCHHDRAVAGVGPCTMGSQTCTEGEFGGWSACEGAVSRRAEECRNGVDDDCDGTIEEGCATIVEVAVDLNGDCLTASCPSHAPYPLACEIHMDGGDHRGCIASRPTDSTVYFQEGDNCGAGRVTGRLLCTTEPGAGLDAANCVINKPMPIYASDRGGCPETDGGFPWF